MMVQAGVFGASTAKVDPMTRCPQCGAFGDPHQGLCAVCATGLEEVRRPHRRDRFDREASLKMAAVDSFIDNPPNDDSDAPLVRIARFRNAAEAGYFADALRRAEQIPTEVAVDEEREAMHGSWSVRFALLVPEPRAESAALALKRLISETNDEWSEPEDFPEQEFPEQEPAPFDACRDAAVARAVDDTEAAFEPAGVNWVPIVITLAFGSAAFVSARKVIEAPRAQPVGAPIGARHETLWDEMSDDPTPWRQPHLNGRGVRELVISPRGDHAILREDTNGDGRFESERVFPLERAGR